MGNVISAISNRAVCMAGAVVVVVAKPACDYTVKVVLKNISLIVGNHLATLEADMKKALALIKETRDSLAEVERAISEQAAKEAPGIGALRFADGIEPKISNTEAMVIRAVEGIEKTSGAIDVLPRTIESRISKVENMVIQAMDSIAKTNDAVNTLPDKMDATAKKYSSYLHDEHVSMAELISAKTA